jgi:two-component system chemotaxis response regulator CheB
VTAAIRVLIVDDSVIVRRILASALAEDPSIEVVGAAPNGRLALAKVPLLSPEVIILDVNMPEMDGLETLLHLRKTYPSIKTIMFSSETERGAAVTLEALARGASDYLKKPDRLSDEETRVQFAGILSSRIRALVGGAPKAEADSKPIPRGPLTPRKTRRLARLDVLAIGGSTGGPAALSTLLASLGQDFPVPIVIVQHMPPTFTRLLAERLTEKTSFRVREAIAGEKLQAGDAWVAPGDWHMTVERRTNDLVLALNQDAPRNSCRPAVDVLFESVARAYGSRTLAVILTGMGRDGFEGCKALKATGAKVLAQDEASSVVWGMPGYVARAGLADGVLGIDALGEEISRLIFMTRASRRRAGGT